MRPDLIAAMPEGRRDRTLGPVALPLPTHSPEPTRWGAWKGAARTSDTQHRRPRKDHLMATSVSSSTHVTHDIAPETIEELRSTIGGTLLEPGQAEFESARSLWNGMIDERPALIAQPNGAADVMRLVPFARDHDLEISIKGGGHNVAGYATTSGGLMIALERMRNVRVDHDR